MQRIFKMRVKQIRMVWFMRNINRILVILRLMAIRWSLPNSLTVFSLHCKALQSSLSMKRAKLATSIFRTALAATEAVRPAYTKSISWSQPTSTKESSITRNGQTRSEWTNKSKICSNRTKLSSLSVRNTKNSDYPSILHACLIISHCIFVSGLALFPIGNY